MLVDTHAHLDDARFDGDRDAVIARATDVGVRFIVDPGGDLASSRKAVELARTHPSVYAATGIHPHEVESAGKDDLREILSLLDGDKVVALGEIGLDYYRDLSPREMQRDFFERQLELAIGRKLPVIIHVRDAFDDATAILAALATEGGIRGVMHCFSGDAVQAERFVAMGLYLGIDGPVTRANAKELHEVVRAVPIEHLLIETDSPWLVPEPRRRSERNEPAFVTLVAAKIAELKGLSPEDVARVTSLNAAELFGIPSTDVLSRVAYPIRHSLYLNITNECPNRCVFCLRDRTDFVKGHRLRLDREPTVDEVMAAVGDPSRYDEVVFCGFGEPTARLDALEEIARRLRSKNVRVRLDLNGLADLLNGRPVAPELAGLIDKVCISVNTAEAKQYPLLCPSRFGDAAYPAILRFIESCREHVVEVELTAVGYPGVDLAAVESLAKKMRVAFRARRYNENRRDPKPDQ